jgi:hypothetical protein
MLTRDHPTSSAVVVSLAGAAVAVLLLACPAGAQTKVDPLSGISKVTVLLAFNATGRAPHGISDDRLQTILELQLRRAGLRVLTQEEDKNDPDVNPYVYLQATILQVRNQGGTLTGYAYDIDLSARVFGVVPFNRSRVPMVLWTDGTVAVASQDDAPADIEGIVGKLIDSFLNAWLKANPK